MNRVSQDVAVEGDVEAVAVVGGMIAAPKKKFGLTITKNCQAMVGTLMGSGTNGTARLVSRLRMFSQKILRKMDLGKCRMPIPKKEQLIRMQFLVLAAVEMMIRRECEQVIVHHAAAAAAVVVDGDHVMARV
jgi:hypothetical protein